MLLIFLIWCKLYYVYIILLFYWNNICSKCSKNNCVFNLPWFKTVNIRLSVLKLKLMFLFYYSLNYDISLFAMTIVCHKTWLYDISPRYKVFRVNDVCISFPNKRLYFRFIQKLYSRTYNDYTFTLCRRPLKLLLFLIEIRLHRTKYICLCLSLPGQY